MDVVWRERIWRRTFTDGSVEEAYSTGEGTGDVLTVVTPACEPIMTIPARGMGSERGTDAKRAGESEQRMATWRVG